MAEKTKFVETLKEQLATAEIDLQNVKKDLDRALSIGLDTTDLQRDFDSQKSQIDLIKKVYNI